MTEPLQRTSVSLGMGNSLYWELYSPDLPEDELKYGDRLIVLVPENQDTPDGELVTYKRVIKVWYGQEDGGWLENPAMDNNFIDSLISDATKNVADEKGIIVRNLNLDPYFNEQEYIKSYKAEITNESTCR